MPDTYLLQGLAVLVVIVLALYGSWSLRRRTRNRWTTTLFFSLITLLLWVGLSPLIIDYALGLEEGDHSTVLNQLAYAVDAIVPAALLLTIAISWLGIARNIGKPLRAPIALGLLFGVLFLLVMAQASAFSGQGIQFLRSADVLVFVRFAGLLAGAATLAFGLAARRTGASHTLVAILTYALALFLFMNLSNKLILPGWIGPILATAIAALFLGTRGIVEGSKSAAGTHQERTGDD